MYPSRLNRYNIVGYLELINKLFNDDEYISNKINYFIKKFKDDNIFKEKILSYVFSDEESINAETIYFLQNIDRFID